MHKTNSLVIAIALSMTIFHGGLCAAATQIPAASPVPVRDSIAPVLDSMPVAPPPSAAADSVKTLLPSTSSTVTVTVGASVPGDSSLADSTKKLDSAKTGQTKKRNRIVRETTVNSIDEIKGRYRSPKKAMFMSLMVPGLGQAYVGQHWANYTRAAAYIMTDMALAFGWHYYVVERQNQQITKYRKFADANWRQSHYENFLSSQLATPDPEKYGFVNPHRQSYCESVQNRDTPTGGLLYLGCLSPIENESSYSKFKLEYNDATWSTDSTSTRRGQFVDPHAFYELLGKEVEFITGWQDAGDNIIQVDSTFYRKGADGNPLKDAQGKFLPATTNLQQEYIGMRAKANDYARMQAYFLGGMVINHLISALDAALTAHYHNKALYQTETSWWDRIHLDGGLAWQGFLPATTVSARLTF